MKIIITSFLFEPEVGGGATMVARWLARMLSQAGHRVTVLTTWSGARLRIEWAEAIKVVRLPASNLYWVANKDVQPVYKKALWQVLDAWNPFIYRLAREVIRAETPDVLHSHKLRGLSPSIWSAAAHAGVPKIVHTCHDFEILSPEGLFMGWVGRLARERSCVMRPYQGLRRRVSNLVNGVSAPSRYVMGLHQQMKFFSCAQVRVIPNTHSLSAGDLSKRSPRLERSGRFLYIGRLDKTKGVDLLCEAFSKISLQHRVSLGVAGWGALETSLRQRYGNQPHIEFFGPVFGKQKDDLFVASDALIAPSIAPESFGIALAEAFSYGLPVIASRIGAYPELVRDEQTGLLVEPGNVDDLRSSVLRLSADLPLYRAMSVNALAQARQLTSERVFADYLRLYEEAASAPCRSLTQ